MNAVTSAEALIECLRGADVDAEQAAVFVHLALRGPSRASEIAHLAGLSRAQTYRALDQLVQAAWVRSSSDRPAVFTANSPEIVLEELDSVLKGRQRLVASAQVEFRNALADRARKNDSPSPNLNLIRGRAEIMRQAQRLLTRSQAFSNILFLHPIACEVLGQYGMVEAFRSATRRGVQVRLLVHVRPKDAPYLEDLRAANVEVRTVDSDRVLAMQVTDQNEVLLGLDADPTGRAATNRDVCILSDSVPLAMLQRLAFDLAWDRPKDVNYILTDRAP